MRFTLWHRLSGAFVFLVSTIVFLMTVAPTLSFWDAGEFITSAVTLGVPHPPGAPLFQLLGRFFSLLPIGTDIGYRINVLSVLASALSVLMTYLTAMRLMRMWKGDPRTVVDALMMIIPAVAGALTLSFSDTFWFNGVETEMYGIGMFFISVVVWMALEWYTDNGIFSSSNTLLLIAYLMGLSIGVHLLSLLALFFVFVLVSLKRHQGESFSLGTLVTDLLVMAGSFAIVYPGIVKFLPLMLSSSFGQVAVMIILVALVALALLQRFPTLVRMSALATVLVVLGFSTYSLVLIRSNDRTAMNENEPNTFEKLYRYLEREQYGGYPLLKGNNYDHRLGTINMGRSVFFPRRWNPDPRSIAAYRAYGESDLRYFLSFQMGHIFGRYFLWNFVGRAGDMQDAPVAWFRAPEQDWSESPGYPDMYYAIPLLLGLLGIGVHFRQDHRTARAMLVLFLALGVGLVVYFNMAEPQVRERDYFFVGAFYVFALWVGLGIFGLVEAVRNRLRASGGLAIGVALALLVIGPGNMLRTNYQTHDRALNYVAFDFAYNLLQSCDKDGIIFTGGDNDTFPLWYCQYVAGVRRDVRVVCLSLLNTGWYARQLKNEEPYGAKKIAMSLSDEQLEQLQPMAWDEQTVQFAVGIEPGLRAALKGFSDPALAVEPDSMSIRVKPTFSDPNGSKGLRMQDFLILDIVRNNIGTRPIYFAVTCGQDELVGLSDFTLCEGLTRRVTPWRFVKKGAYFGALHTEKVARHLLNPIDVPTLGPKSGFLFRELANPAVNLDEASARMISTYRIEYFALAEYLSQDSTRLPEARAVLKKMNIILPPSIHEMGLDMRIDLGTLYSVVGEVEEYRKLAPDIEAYFMKEITKEPDQWTGRNPLLGLLRLYEATNQYQKGLELVQGFVSRYPGDPYLKEFLAKWQALVSQHSTKK